MWGYASELRRQNDCSHSVVGYNDAIVKTEGRMNSKTYRHASVV